MQRLGKISANVTFGWCKPFQWNPMDSQPEEAYWAVINSLGYIFNSMLALTLSPGVWVLLAEFNSVKSIFKLYHYS